MLNLDLHTLAAVCGGQQASGGRDVQIPVESYTATGWDKQIPNKINQYDVRCVSASDYAKALGQNFPEVFKGPDGTVGEGKICTFMKKP